MPLISQVLVKFRIDLLWNFWQI